MNPVIDDVIVALLIVVSLFVVVYALSPLKAKRWILSKLSPVIGVRIITKLLPNQCGCDGCPTAKSPRDIPNTSGSINK